MLSLTILQVIQTLFCLIEWRMHTQTSKTQTDLSNLQALSLNQTSTFGNIWFFSMIELRFELFIWIGHKLYRKYSDLKCLSCDIYTTQLVLCLFLLTPALTDQRVTEISL